MLENATHAQHMLDQNLKVTVTHIRLVFLVTKIGPTMGLRVRRKNHKATMGHQVWNPMASSSPTGKKWWIILMI